MKWYRTCCLSIFLIFSVVILNVGCQKNVKNGKDYTSKIPQYDTVTYKVFRVDSGWGYDIYVNRRIFIHQPYIPAVQGRFVFMSREAARKVAILVIHKMMERPGLPAVSVSELDSLGVLYDTVKKFQQYLIYHHRLIKYKRLK